MLGFSRWGRQKIWAEVTLWWIAGQCGSQCLLGISKCPFWPGRCIKNGTGPPNPWGLSQKGLIKAIQSYSLSTVSVDVAQMMLKVHTAAGLCKVTVRAWQRRVEELQGFSEEALPPCMWWEWLDDCAQWLKLHCCLLIILCAVTTAKFSFLLCHFQPITQNLMFFRWQVQPHLLKFTSCTSPLEWSHALCRGLANVEVRLAYCLTAHHAKW